MNDDYSDEIERRKRHIKGDEQLSDQERETLLQLHQEIESHNQRVSAKKQISGTRHKGYLDYAHRLVKHTDGMLYLLEEDRDEETVDEIIEEIGAWINDYENGYTRDNYVSAFRAWGRHLSPDAGGETPERFLELELGNVEDDQPAPEPSEVLFWSDVTTLIDATSNRIATRTAAMIALLWASGLRPMSEFWELQVGQLDDRGDHMYLSVRSDSKTFRRTIRINVGLPYIRKWLKEHPANDTDAGLQSDTYLWTPTNDNRLLNYAQIRKSIKRVAEDTDITKPVNPEHFRASRASILASSHYVTQRDLENHFGWVRGSRVAAHYIAVFESQSRKHIAKADGAEVTLEEEMEPIIPVWCETCDRQTPRHRETCLWCDAETLGELDRQPRVGESPIATEEDERDLLDLVVDGAIDADDLRALKKLAPVIRRRGEELFERLDNYIEFAERNSS